VRRRLRAVAAVAAAAAVAVLGLSGCAVVRHSDTGTSDARATVERIEGGAWGWGRSVRPLTRIESDRRFYGLGQDINVTVRLIAPKGKPMLDSYLPIRGRLCVSRERALFHIKPRAGSERLAWIEFPPDQKAAPERSFTVALTRIFPISEPGWYEIWWEGSCLVASLRSEPLYVRVYAELPSEGPAGR